MSLVRRRAWDTFVLVTVVLVLFDVLVSDQDVPLALSVPVGLAMSTSILWGQRRPALVATIVLGAWVGQALAGDWELEPQSELLPVALVFWALGAYLPRRQAFWSFMAAIVALVVHEPGDVVVMGPLMSGVFAAGRLMQSREQLARALEEERGHAERYAVAEERARIARELHDVVGHAVSLMTIQAGAERLALADERPETSAALEQIELTGRRTMQEMRRLLGVLRTPEEQADLSPRPGVAQLDDLAARLSSTGLAVDVTVEGEPRLMSPGVDVSVYRIAQEALTNVLKHADARRAQVRVVHEPSTVRIEVTDDGASSSKPGEGYGLTGMRERVAVYGGSLEAGPSPGGGWRLVAVLPREPEP
jgi:signal transduction histidine kinase